MASPRLHNSNLVGLSMKNLYSNLNRYLYIGTTVLDVIKLIIYRFNFEYSIVIYGRAYVYVWHTAYLFYDICIDAVYKDMVKSLDVSNASKYLTTHPCLSTMNKKQLVILQTKQKCTHNTGKVCIIGQLVTNPTHDNIYSEHLYPLPFNPHFAYWRHKFMTSSRWRRHISSHRPEHFIHRHHSIMTWDTWSHVFRRFTVYARCIPRCCRSDFMT